MMLYALGALELFDGIYDISTVSMTIFQPRRDNVSTQTVLKESLYRWAEEILRPAADLAYAGEGEFCSGEWCRFCRAKNGCRARAEENLALARYDFRLPPLLSDEEIEAVLGQIDELVSWAADIREHALQAALRGKRWSGWKLVEGRSNRRYINAEAVAAAVSAAGFDPYERSVLSVTEMERVLGKARFRDLLGGLVEKPTSKPTLVPEIDKRPEITNANHDFMEGMENG